MQGKGQAEGGHFPQPQVRFPKSDFSASVTFPINSTVVGAARAGLPGETDPGSKTSAAVSAIHCWVATGPSLWLLHPPWVWGSLAFSAQLPQVL